jgi:flagellar export protein FliJ
MFGHPRFGPQAIHSFKVVARRADTDGVSRFKFRLDPVLAHRERQEDLARRDLAQAIAAVAAQQELAVAAERELESQIDNLRGTLQAGGALPLHELRQRHEGLERARRIAEHEAAGVEALENVAVERRDEAIVASQAVGALEKLREQHKVRHVSDAERVDGALMDELALRAHRAGVGGAAA